MQVEVCVSQVAECGVTGLEGLIGNGRILSEIFGYSA
jgi:hypothetical protein